MKYIVILFSAAWAACALWYPMQASHAWRMAAVAGWLALAALAALALWRRDAAWLLALYALVLAGIIIWWVMLPPVAGRQWADDVARISTGEVYGSQVTLRDVRNFDWRSETDYSPRWEVREYDLDRLVSVDALMSYWAGPAIAHTLVSFGFDDGRYVTFSVEIRKQRDEAFSEVGGFFKQFELGIVAADERDIVRVRSNIRGEDVYLYRIDMSQATMRSLFLAYVGEANRLAAAPRFYHTLTVNCTTLIYQMMTRIVAGLPLDYRLLLSGYLPSYIRDVGGLDNRHTLAQLRALGRITLRARAADRRPDFSAAIREGIPALPLPGDAK